jgi:hypothetical protein
VNVHCT